MRLPNGSIVREPQPTDDPRLIVSLLRYQQGVLAQWVELKRLREAGVDCGVFNNVAA